MGLNERRKIAELRDVTFPGRVKDIDIYKLLVDKL